MNEIPARHQGRGFDELRPLVLQRAAAPYAEGSCLVSMGGTRVLCTASVEEGVPGWRRGSGEGWVTAEYAMLPRATHQRTRRERGELGGRTQEIQRLIGRSLRACVDLQALGEWTIRIDCDVLQADGGTRTTSITGGAVALHDACLWIARQTGAERSAFREFVAAVSGGIVDGHALLDLDYPEDSRADVDMNLVASEGGALIEVQGTGERTPFSVGQFQQLVQLALDGIVALVQAQQEAIR